jgi:hypothetical protein
MLLNEVAAFVSDHGCRPQRCAARAPSRGRWMRCRRRTGIGTSKAQAPYPLSGRAKCAGQFSRLSLLARLPRPRFKLRTPKVAGVAPEVELVAEVAEEELQAPAVAVAPRVALPQGRLVPAVKVSTGFHPGQRTQPA